MHRKTAQLSAAVVASLFHKKVVVVPVPVLSVAHCGVAVVKLLQPLTVTTAKKVNRKMSRGAVAAILSELRRKDALILVDKVELDSPKTKDLLAKTKSLGLSNALIVTENAAGNVALASRNLYDIAATDAAHVNPVALLRFEKVVMSEDSVRKLEESLA
jgi:ribosomal protein L4